MDGTKILIGVVALTCVGVLVFLICREIVCWYWKINEGIELLQQAVAQLKGINSKLDVAAARQVPVIQPVEVVDDANPPEPRA